MAAFFVNDEQKDQFETIKSARLLYARRHLYEKNWHSHLHSHAHAEMFYITKGIGSFLFDMQSKNVSSGDFIIINEGVRHTEISSSESPLEYIVLGVKGLDAVHSPENNDEFVLLDSAVSHELLPLMEGIANEDESLETHALYISEYILKALLLKLLRHTYLISSQNDDITRHSSKECAAIKRYIDIHHKEDLTLEDIATNVHISKYYMIHIFKKEYGITPISYLQYKRISESKRLLEETHMSAVQISTVLGFSSPSQFTQCFKRLTSITPTEYRRKSTSAQTKA